MPPHDLHLPVFSLSLRTPLSLSIQCPLPPLSVSNLFVFQCELIYLSFTSPGRSGRQGGLYSAGLDVWYLFWKAPRY